MPFPVNFAKFLRTPFLLEHLRWLLLELFLGRQSVWYFSRNTIFPRMNVIFFSGAGDVTLACIFFFFFYLCFFCHEGIIIYVSFMHIYRKLYFHVFLNKDHLLSRRKNLIISGKKKYHLSRYYIKDHIQVRIFWRDNLFRTHEENTFEKDHLSFCV